MNDNWRAKCDQPGHVVMRPFGSNNEMVYGFSTAEAAELRDELTKAIEEAKRLADPFERWWDGLNGCGNYRNFKEWVIGKEVARAIWNAAKGG